MNVWLVFIFVMFFFNSGVYCKHVVQEQRSASAASDLGRHRLLVSFLRDTRYKWVRARDENTKQQLYRTKKMICKHYRSR